MSDNLEWQKRHLTLLRYTTVNELYEKEAFKIRPDLASFFENKTSVEEIFWDFSNAGRYKCACEMLAYIGHRRAVVWWAYQCVLSLMEELKEKADEEFDFNKVCESYEPVVPDFAKVEPLNPKDPKADKMMEEVQKMNAEIAELRKLVDPEVMAEVDEAVKVAMDTFKDIHGISFDDLIQMAVKKDLEHQQVDENSPIFKAAEDIEAKLHASKKETLAKINAVLPPKVPAFEKKISDDALSAVYRWVVAPDEVNSQRALDAGNACPDKPAGLLALSTFWSFGNMLPEGDTVVHTPPGLAANGICQTLLTCALAKGGTRTLKERYQHYVDLGIRVMIGEFLWDEAVLNGEVPHKDVAKKIEEDKKETAPVETIDQRIELDKQLEEERRAARPKVYTRWKPDIK
ncbi:MAG: hypothetical protein MJ250_05725 [Alphaproteobacteria bacterium]|nr:hypothetical protein [Alphaproteobacteria bacterium]